MSSSASSCEQIILELVHSTLLSLMGATHTATKMTSVYTLPMSSLSITGFLGRVGGEGSNILSAGSSGSEETSPKEKAGGSHQTVYYMRGTCHRGRVLAVAHRVSYLVFSGSDRRHRFWFHWEKPRSSCTGFLLFWSSPSLVQNLLSTIDSHSPG